MPKDITATVPGADRGGDRGGNYDRHAAAAEL